MSTQQIPIKSLFEEPLRRQDTESFFRRKLGDVEEPTAPFGVLDGSRIQEAHQEVDLALSKRIHAQARRLRVSSATMFHAAWSLVVAHTSGRDDVVFGSVPLGRLQGDVGAPRILGTLINVLPLRVRLQSLSAKTLVERTQRELVELLSHEQASLAVAQRCSGIMGSAPLFTAVLNYRHSAPNSEAEWAESQGIRTPAAQNLTNYPITLSVDDREESFGLTAQTDQRVDPHRMTGYLHTAIQSLVNALEEAPQTAALALTILPPDEHGQVLYGFNATQAAYPKERLIHELFEEQVERTPDTVAVVYEDQSLTYARLNARANQLAHYLRRRGIGPDQLVGICVERSVEMVVGLLGILKAGGAYVPLDPNYPPERLHYMTLDAAPSVLLIQQQLEARLPQTEAEVIALDQDWDVIARQPDTNPDASTPAPGAHHLAYVIYTSGSTGRPKGAMNEHGAVLNRMQWMQDQYQLGAADRVLQKTPFSFDVSVWEFFWTLMSGARLIMARPEGHRDPGYLQQLIEETGITTLHFVPSMLQIFVDHCEPGQCASLRHIVCSGEELSASLQKKCLERFPQARLSNLYGPTEAAVDVTAWECRAGDESLKTPIGHPISNIHICILDGQLQPVPIGVPAEIYIGGVGVGRGYLRRPDLTADRFIADPFGDGQSRMYRTGDLGQWRDDGTIEYLGRNDHQVKIRGFRIELGEIEAQLTRQDQVKEAVVLVREDVPGEKRLVAYVVPAPAEELSAEALRTALKEVLPEYMVPSAFVTLERFPLTPNGKLDRRALPAPDLNAYSRRTYEAPKGGVEETLAELWRELLNVERVGRQDDFFDLGGNSLDGMRLAVRVAEKFSIQLPALAAFQYPTVRQMAEAAEQAQSLIARAPLCADLETGRIPLSFQQQTYWKGSSTRSTRACLITAELRLKGSLDTDILRKSFDLVIQRHDSLRTLIVVSEGVPEQRFVSHDHLRLDDVFSEVTLNAASDVNVRLYIEEFFSEPIDLARGPVIKILLMRLTNDEHALAVAVHHVASDAISFEVLFRELWSTYRDLLNRRPTLPTRAAMQYAEYVAWQRQMRGNGSGHSAQPTEVHYLRAPIDPGLENLKHTPLGEIVFALDGKLTAQLHELARMEHVPVAIVTLCLHCVVLSRWCGQREFFMPFGFAGRNLSEHVDIIGLFTVCVFLKIEIRAEDTFSDLIRRVYVEFVDESVRFDDGSARPEAAEIAKGAGFHWIPGDPEELAGVPTISGWSSETRGLVVERLRPRSMHDEDGVTDQFELPCESVWRFWETAHGITGHAYYRADRFRADTMRHFVEALKLTASQAARDPQARIPSFEPLIARSASIRC